MATGCKDSGVFFSNPLMSDEESSWSPIHDAAFNGRLLTLQRLIAQGACVNLSTQDQVLPLHGACVQGHKACVELLLKHGANVNAATVDGQTALAEACARGHVTCVSLLLQHGATSLGTGRTSSPIHRAAAQDEAECIEALAQHGADLDHYIETLGSPLHVATSNHHLRATTTLLKLGASVNLLLNGNSPLHIAARLPSPELMSVLLEHGADRFLLNWEGKRPVDFAASGSLVEGVLRQTEGVFPLIQLCRFYIRKTVGRRLSSSCDSD